MFGESIMSYTYDETEALRHSASFLGAFALFLAFLGGYFSYQNGWWWMVFFVVLVFRWFHGFLDQPHNKRYDKIIQSVVALIAALIFLVIFLFGSWAARQGFWFLGILPLGVYFILAKIIHKPRNKKKKKH